VIAAGLDAFPLECPSAEDTTCPLDFGAEEGPAIGSELACGAVDFGAAVDFAPAGDEASP